jgi:hypothetical protein
VKCGLIEHTGTGSIVNESLPYMDRRLTDNADGVLAGQIQSRQDAIAALCSQRLSECTFGVVCSSGVGHGYVVFFNLRLSTDARDLEEKFSDKGDRGLLLALEDAQ